MEKLNSNKFASNFNVEPVSIICGRIIKLYKNDAILSGCLHAHTGLSRVVRNSFDSDFELPDRSPFNTTYRYLKTQIWRVPIC